ncbi:AraC family transcriptional regulator, partial [Prevotella sp. MGM2]|uniref:helix-turn-helix domain-containing protein n=1 Tax=Prevotella sp. MGM2 TaxID=2033406 RepID=UPI000D0C6FDC
YNIFDKFIHLLSDNFRSERNVSWYSDQLCLTPKYLSEVVKNVSGRTAGQWIANFVVMEIKQLLANTSLSVKEIAVRLNFSNQSFLGKYFKNATGFSPSDYRK